MADKCEKCGSTDLKLEVNFMSTVKKCKKCGATQFLIDQFRMSREELADLKAKGDALGRAFATDCYIDRLKRGG